MVTIPSNSPSPSPPPVAGQADIEATADESGFFSQLVKSVWEPGVNNAAILAMNVSFFLLILVLFALAFLTSWNKHVLLLLVVTTLLWGSMAWFVIEITKLQGRPDNLPIAEEEPDTDSPTNISDAPEPKKDR